MVFEVNRMNKNKNKKLIIIAVVFICIILSKINVFANTLEDRSSETLAVTLVIDTSGSMAETDPQKLRETAANIFIDLLSSNDYLSIITFNTKEEVVLPMQQIENSDNKANFKKILSEKLQATGDTDYLLALNEANKQLSSIKDGNIRKVILFLTDGEPAPNSTVNNDPTLMNSYMDSLWKTVSDLSLNKYAVYSVGFSEGVDSAILERISNSTQGALKISNDSSELALNFFDILGNLKNRKEFLNKTVELKGSNSLKFDLDEYTSQATMVFTNSDGIPFDVTLSAPNGKSTENVLTVNESDKYKIVTINQQNEKLTGKWQVNIEGNGIIKAFGNKDLFIKSWLVNPEPTSLHPLNEPLEISVNVTGEIKENISIEAIVTKNGVKDKTPIKLEIKDGLFTGTYKNVDKVGTYDIETTLMLNGQVITKNNTSFFVRELPSISTDFLEKDTVYRLNESLTVTAFLNMAGNKPFNSNEIKIENYNLILNYTNSDTETIPLLDNGLADIGDNKENDGIWSNKVVFNKEDVAKSSLIVNGTYKGEKFLLEKSLGSFKVYPPGKLLIKPLRNNLYTSLNKQLKIPVEIVNTSNFTETMIITLDKSIGKLANDKIKIEPLENVQTYIYVDLDNTLEKKVYDTKIKIATEYPKTKVEPEEFTTKIEVLSKTGYLQRYLKDNITFIITLLGIFLGLPLLIILLGLLLYRLLVHRNTLVEGKLLYWKEEDTNLKDKKEFDLNKVGKSKIIITFNEENKNAQYHIFSNEYNYDIELTSIIQKSRWKFIDGFKALFHRNNFSDLLLKTTEPGIFIYENKVFTSKKIYKNDRFTTAGYVFEYLIDDKRKSTNKDKGNNVLEGKLT